MKVWLSVCFLAALAFNFAACQPNSAYVYAVSSVDANSEGIVLYHLNLTTGELSKIRGTTGLPSPSYIAIDKKHNYLYSVNEDETGGVVYAYSIDQNTGDLKYLNQQYSNGGPVYVFLDHTNQVLLTANYGAGSVMSFPIDTKTGKIGSVAAVDQHYGKSVNPDRQEGPHAHFVMMDPTNVFAMSVDLGTDQVWSCTLNPSNGKILPAHNHIAYTATPGAGPRHLIFHPNGKFVYIIHELGNIIVAASYDNTNGLFTDLQTISTLPKDFQGESYAAAINILPNGKYLYGSNRGDASNNIAVFKVDQDTGFLTLIQHISVEGNYPRDFTIDPTGRVLLVGNEKSSNVTTFLINPDTGLLTYSGHSVDLPTPQCLKVIQKFATQANLESMQNISEQEEQNFENLAKLAREQNKPKGGISLGATKNGVCKMFLHSTCNNYECGFLHDTSRVQPCQNYANNLCKFGDACEFNHQLNLVPVKTCNNMRHQGYCEKGDCKFKHLLYTCLGFDKGYCQEGKHCIKAHVRRELCKNYMYGFCPEGPNCLYAHPKLLMDWDAKFFHEIDPKIRVIKCNKCNILGHKANNCLSRKTVEILNTCEHCNCWHWKDNPCPYETEEPSMPIESLGDAKIPQQQITQ